MTRRIGPRNSAAARQTCGGSRASADTVTSAPCSLWSIRFGSHKITPYLQPHDWTRVGLDKSGGIHTSSVLQPSSSGTCQWSWASLDDRFRVDRSHHVIRTHHPTVHRLDIVALPLDEHKTGQVMPAVLITTDILASTQRRRLTAVRKFGPECGSEIQDDHGLVIEPHLDIMTSQPPELFFFRIIVTEDSFYLYKVQCVVLRKLGPYYERAG